MTERTCAACAYHAVNRDTQEYECALACRGYSDTGEKGCLDFMEREYRWPALQVADRQKLA